MSYATNYVWNGISCGSFEYGEVEDYTIEIWGATQTNYNFNWSPSTSLSNDSILTPYASPTSSIDYILTALDSNSCSNSDTVNVTVNPLPNVVASTATSCDSDTITLNGSGASTYNWNQGLVDGQAFVVDIDSTYIVSGTDTNGCINSDTANLTIYPLPNVSAGIDQIICNGDSTQLTASGTNTYSWDNGVVDGQYFVPTSSSDYIVTGTDTNSCSKTDTVFITINSNTPYISYKLVKFAC